MANKKKINGLSKVKTNPKFQKPVTVKTKHSPTKAKMQTLPEADQYSGVTTVIAKGNGGLTALGTQKLSKAKMSLGTSPKSGGTKK